MNKKILATALFIVLAVVVLTFLIIRFYPNHEKQIASENNQVLNQINETTSKPNWTIEELRELINLQIEKNNQIINKTKHNGGFMPNGGGY